MDYRMMPNILVVVLMAVCATLASNLLDPLLAGNPVAVQDVIAAVVDPTRTAELFGDQYQRPVLLYKGNSQELEALKRLPEQMRQLKDQIEALKYLNRGNNPQATTGEDKLKRIFALVAGQLPIKNLVKEYNQTKNWQALRKGLDGALEHDSPAHRQLLAVSQTEEYPPWQIGYDGFAELAMVLAWAGDGLDMRDGGQDNLLHGAVAGGKVLLVRNLLDSGADIESRNKWGNAPLALACKYRRLGVARLLVARGADPDGVDYNEKWAGLARAANDGDLEIVKFMVEAGASTTILDKEGRTPLELARGKGHTAVVEYLSQFPH